MLGKNPFCGGVGYFSGTAPSVLSDLSFLTLCDLILPVLYIINLVRNPLIHVFMEFTD